MRCLSVLMLFVWGLATLAGAETVTFPDGRGYDLSRPDRGQPVGVIVALHGGGGSGGHFAAASGLARDAGRRGYAVVFPDGTSAGGPFLTWNAGYCCAAAAHRGVDDLAFLDRVISDATARLGGATLPVFVTGMSNGAMMAEAYAAQRPAMIRAVAGVAGTLDLSYARPRGPMPALLIHGTADDHVPFAGGRGGQSFTQVDFTTFESVARVFRAATGQTLTATTSILDPSPDDMRTLRTDYRDAAGRVWQRTLVIEGGGHAWPGGRRSDRQGGTRDFAANDALLDFFDLWR